jgi:flagellar hook-basal body complex protein FliE
MDIGALELGSAMRIPSPYPAQAAAAAGAAGAAASAAGPTVTLPVAPAALEAVPGAAGAGSVSPVEFAAASSSAGAPSASGPSFGDRLQAALDDVDAKAKKADETAVAFALGEPVEVHQVVLAAEQARLSLLVVAEVRNRLSDAYQELIKTSA